jgi:signal peptidase I
MTLDPATPAPSAPAPSTPPAPTTRRSEGGYRDTIESILIAFILAFVFRAFVVEAFVIPTGSMAPTLLGAHARFTCSDCGYEFKSNFSAGENDAIPAEVPHGAFPTPQPNISDRDRHIDCPNCGFVLHDPIDGGNARVPIHYGDRILVLKYAYLAQDPRRWDVVVFKSPDDPSRDAGWYTTNFIKRLVGRPNETLMILDGDIYVSSDNGTSPSQFKLQSKPRHVQEALWRIVYDNEFLPKRSPGQPWKVQAGAGWDLGTPDKPRRTFTFDGAKDSSGSIHFDHSFNDGRAFTDWLAYAQQDSDKNKSNVSDIKLSLLYDRKSGDGPLRLSLTKQSQTFTAVLTPGSAKLFRKSGSPPVGDDIGQEIAAAPNVPSLNGGAIQIEFTNVDHVVTLRIGNSDVLHIAYDPDIAALKDAYTYHRDMPKPEVVITAAGQACAISHVGLWRDVYYINEPPSSIRWGRPDDPIKLGKDEYFVLGDNTVISKDARYWDKPIDLPAEDLHVEAGRVPGRFLLGKAFFVYWPAGYRPFGSSNLPGLIPNFGEMRVIH